MNALLFSLFKRVFRLSSDLVPSQLYNENTFYPRFLTDLKQAKKEVIVESPFISSRRMSSLTSIFQKLVDRKIKVYVFTRDPQDQKTSMRLAAETAIRQLESMGVQVVISTDNSHRKIAIIDQHVLWEGSLNILSQNNSRE